MIGENIKKYRTQKGITQKDLAEKLFVTSQAVSRWENGEVEPSISTVNSISKILEISIDELLGNEVKKTEPEVITETKYVYQEPIKPVLGVCEKCNKPIYEASEIIRWTTGRSRVEHVCCKNCKEKKDADELKTRINKSNSRRKKSFWIGGIVSGLWIVIAICLAVAKSSALIALINILLAILAFTFISCCLFENNFIGDMTLEIFSWGFVRMPGLIFTLDLDGIVWLLTVKLFLWILGIALAILFGVLAVTLGACLSVFVYPFAIVKNIKHPEEID